MKRKVRRIIKDDKEEKDSLFEEIKFKSQAAMEYLMTYGWAILIIALTLGVLYSLGIMNPKNFIPRAPLGSCFVFRPNGPGTTDFVSLQGTCGYLPMYVASFNGVNAYVVNVTPTGSLAFTTQPFTVTLWSYPFLQKSSYPALLQKGKWGSDGWGAGYESNKIVFYDRGRAQKYYSVNVYPPNKWYYIAFIRQGLNVSIVVNGVLDSTFSLSGNLILSTQPFSIGASVEGSLVGNFYAGIIANVQIYNTALTPQEIQYLYQQGLGGGPVRLQNLVAWWPLNGDAKDYSGNNNHGTINGGVTFIQNYNPP